MQKFIETITSTSNGALVPLDNATVTVYVAGTLTLATLYSTNSTSTPRANPLTSSATGLVSFYAADGRYDIRVAKSGFTTVTISDVLLEDPSDELNDSVDRVHITVTNNNGATFVPGQVVKFVGVTGGVPTAQLATANSAFMPIYTVGVVAETIAVGNSGQIRTQGKVTGVNTTGSLVSESWVAGDILYMHPTIAGGLTKVEPAEPNVSVSVAVVLTVNATVGVLLVRPILHMRARYGNFTCNADQSALVADTAYPVVFTGTDVSVGVALDGVDASKVVCSRAGLYNFQFSAQLVKSNSSVGYAYIWPRVGGVDIPNSSTKVSIQGSNSEVIPAWNFVLPMLAGQEFQLMYAFSATSITFEALPATAFCPAIPSVILSVTQINQ
jgi:hypothetical protein